MTNLLDKLNLKPQERRIVVIAAIVIFIVLNVMFVFPLFGELGRTQQRITDAQKMLNEFESEVGKKPSYEKLIAEMKGKSQEIPSQDVAVDLMREVQSAVALNRIDAKRYDAGTKTTSYRTNAFFDEQTLVIGLGPTDQRDFIKFLYELSSRETMTRVRSLNLSHDPPRQKLIGSITFVRSYQRKPPARGSVGSTQAASTTPVPAPTNPAKPPASASTNALTSKPRTSSTNQASTTKTADTPKRTSTSATNPASSQVKPPARTPPATVRTNVGQRSSIPPSVLRSNLANPTLPPRPLQTNTVKRTPPKSSPGTNPSTPPTLP